MKKEEKVAEFLREEGYNVSAEDILIGQFVPSFLQNFITFIPKYIFLAYNDKEKYPTGPWCKKGDWVIFARYAGSRIEIEGGEVRLLNDDEILATVRDPTDILHKY